AGLAGAGQAGDADEAVPRQADGYVLEVVLAGAVDDELVGSHSGNDCTARTCVREGPESPSRRTPRPFRRVLLRRGSGVCTRARRRSARRCRSPRRRSVRPTDARGGGGGG